MLGWTANILTAASTQCPQIGRTGGPGVCVHNVMASLWASFRLRLGKCVLRVVTCMYALHNGHYYHIGT